MSYIVIYVQLFAMLSCAYVSSGSIEAVLRGAESATGFILRNKRDPSRSLTFSGFVPGGGMSAFASSADFSPYYRSNRPSYRNRWSAPLPPAEDDRPADGESPNTELRPPQEAAGDEKHWSPEQGEPEVPAQGVPSSEDASVASPDDAKKPKKKYNRRPSPRDEREDDDDEYERPGSGGNAAASFNAWFPIMLGMFPPSGYQQPGQSDGLGYSGSGSGHGRNPSGYTTVVANSVSHGRNGVASSHAVAYGGGSLPQPQQQQQQRPQNIKG